MDSERKCLVCGEGNLIKTDIFDELTVRKYSCGHGEKIAIKNETINIGENISTQMEFHFKFSDRIFVGGKITSSKDITLELDPDDNNYLFGFAIRVSSADPDNGKVIAIQKATKLTNLLSVKIGEFVYHNRPEMTVVRNGKTTRTISYTIDVVLVKKIDLDLKKPEILSLINNNSKINQKLAHFARGLKATEENDPIVMIREFYQVIEGEGLSNQEKYRCLRNVVHDKEVQDDVSQIVSNEFGISFLKNTKTNGNYIDYTSVETINKLKIAAQSLKADVVAHLKSTVVL